MSLPIPEEGLVYDYRIEDGGLFGSAGQGKKGEEEEEEEKAKGKTKVSFCKQSVYCYVIFISGFNSEHAACNVISVLSKLRKTVYKHACNELEQFLYTLHTLSFISLLQVAWVGWMDRMSEFVVDPKQRFSDIIVPTMDTVRGSYLIGLLLQSSKQVRT